MDSSSSIANSIPSSPPEDLLSSQLSSISPQRPTTYVRNSRKERGTASITPRKFRRFFTPRSSDGMIRSSPARQALFEITAPSLNRNVVQSSPLRPFRNVAGQENGSSLEFPRDLKRRKTIHTPERSPDSTIIKERSFVPLDLCQNEDEDLQSSSRQWLDRSYDKPQRPVAPTKRIKPVTDRGLSAQLLNMSINGYPRRRRQHHSYPIDDWQCETSAFYSRPDDVHISTSILGTERCIPFCVAACNTNSLVALGDEEGRVRLLESAHGGKPGFENHYLAFRVHTNAIIDMQFSDDDARLATASGDQSARVVDMSTQRTIAILGHHSASLKQIRFQPGSTSNSVLATSSRDGTVHVWDIRTRGDSGPQLEIHVPVDDQNYGSNYSERVHYGRPINSIYKAHQPPRLDAPVVLTADNPSYGEASGRLGELSVTAIQFLPAGQENLLLTASEADASVRLWDIRLLGSKNGKCKKGHSPLSITRQPNSHTQWRHFGISSLTMGGDGSRLYTLCKDNTVYAYSTAHLILGHAPELTTTSRPSPQRSTKEGLAPLYGFRHPQLHATSFYVKAAIRKAKEGKSEMLAVGSSDGSPVLFPTDERYLPKSEFESTFCQSDYNMRPLRRRRRQHSTIGNFDGHLGLASRVEEDIQISTRGTPLVRGHDREVSSLTWTSQGNLVTVGDDFLVRCWREGEDARDLRTRGESEGRRWACGWADVEDNFDKDDDQ